MMTLLWIVVLIGICTFFLAGLWGLISEGEEKSNHGICAWCRSNDPRDKYSGCYNCLGYYANLYGSGKGGYCQCKHQ